MVVVAVFIEPAPYILDLLRVTRERHPDVELRVYFISAALTQDWGSRLDDIAILLPANPWSALRVLLSDIVSGKFDVLHLAGWGNPLMLCSLIVGGLYRRKITVESDTQLPIGLAFWKRVIKRILYPVIFSLVDIAFPGGSRQKQYFEYYGVPVDKIRIAQMTVDVNSIALRSDLARLNKLNLLSKWNLPEVGTLFLYVGRLNIHKGGVHDLIEAFARLNHLKDIGLVIAGDGELHDFVVSSASPSSRITYLGRLPADEIPDLYAVGDVLVLPSHSENWGLVVNEAMASCLPVITSDRVGCVDDLVIHGQTGMIFSSGNVAKLAEAMQFLSGNKKQRQLMGDAGKQRIKGWKMEDESDILCSGWKFLGCDCK